MKLTSTQDDHSSSSEDSIFKAIFHGNFPRKPFVMQRDFDSWTLAVQTRYGSVPCRSPLDLSFLGFSKNRFEKLSYLSIKEGYCQGSKDHENSLSEISLFQSLSQATRLTSGEIPAMVKIDHKT